MNIYAGNLSNNVSEDDLQTAFANYGQVGTVNLIRDRFSGESRGFGFIEMPSKEEAKAAIEALDGAELKGKSIKVNEAKPRENNQDRNGGRGGRSGGYGHSGKRW